MSNTDKFRCEEALKHLFEYLDKDLSGTLQQQMEQHMEGCRNCYSRLAFEQTLKSHPGDAATDKAPNMLRGRINNLIKSFEK